MFLLIGTLLLFPILILLSAIYIKGSLPECVTSATAKIIVAMTPVFINVVMWVARFINKSRSDYIWENRINYPKCVSRILDKVMNVDPLCASLCRKSGYDSIRVDEAILTYEGMDYDVTEMMDIIWVCGVDDTVSFNFQRTLCYENILVNNTSNMELRVKYTGHCNPNKRHFPQTFSVKYVGIGTDVVSFPPYPSSETVKKGLGVIKIKDAVREDDTCCLVEATESAGLRGKFYSDIEDSSIVPNVVNFFDESQQIHEDLKINVNTSKGPLELH